MFRDKVPSLKALRSVGDLIAIKNPPDEPESTPIDIGSSNYFTQSSASPEAVKTQGNVAAEKPISYDRRSSPYTYLALPVTISWKDLEVRVRAQKNANACSSCGPKRYILRKVTGMVQSGTLLAIMGSSGAGKSTLMNVLTERNIKGLEVSGTIHANGVTVGREIRNISAYVQQDDLFLGTLTVREQLQFRALICMDKALTKDQRMNRVEDVIAEMGLTACANSEIGASFGSGRGISGGERKRLSFASETLNKPPLIFCDEPTSGLDTFMAQNIVISLQRMASKGHTVLCTIHQPSSEIFAMFHQLLLMSGGRVAYDGSCDGAMEFFSRLNYPCPQNFNPADHYILTLAIKPDKEEESRERASAICDAFSRSERNGEIQYLVDRMVNADMGDARMLKETIQKYQESKATILTQFRCLFWRSWVSLYRNIFLFRIRFAQSIIFAVVLGSIYFDLSLDQKGVMNFNGAIFVLIINVTFSNAFAVFNSFPNELGIFLREYGSGLYRTDVYFLATTIAEAPMFSTMSVLFVSVVYWMIGFYKSINTFLWAQLVLYLTSMIGTSFGYFVSTMCGSVAAALAIGPPILIPFMLFGGLFINIDTIPFYFRWVNYISWFQYANEIFMVKHWINIDKIDCPGQDATGYSSPTNRSHHRVVCRYLNGRDVLAYTSFKKDDVVFDVIMMCVLLVGFRMLAFLALLLRAHQSKE